MKIHIRKSGSSRKYAQLAQAESISIDTERQGQDLAQFTEAENNYKIGPNFKLSF